MREIPQHRILVAITAVVTSLSSVAFGTSNAQAQTGVPSANPTVPAQSYDARQLELQRVREAAQRARASAQKAAMARSADRALEEQHIKSNVDRSLEYKKLKAQAAAQAKSQTAPNGYQGVSPGEIKAWQDPNADRVTVQRDVPQQFNDTIAREDDDAEEKSGGIGSAVKGVLSWRPSIPFIGKNKKKNDRGVPALPQFTPAEQLGLNDAPPPVQAPAAKPKKEKKSSNGGGLKIPLIGGLLGGNKKDKAEEASPYVAPAPAPAPQPTVASASDEQESSKPGLLTRMNPFSKKDDAELGNPYDAPTYPSDAADLPSSSGSGGQEASAGLFGPVGESADGSTVVSSGAADDEDKPGFFGRLFGGGDKAGKADKGSSNGEAKSVRGIYVVDSKDAQLIIFGNATISSDAKPMPIGSIVRVTKDGEEWYSVQLTSGTEGIMRKKMLRPAKADEGSVAMFAHLDKPRYPTTARINRSRSASGASSSRPSAPVNVPTPDLPNSGDAPSTAAPDAPVGNSLLPPLPASAVE